MSRHIIQHADQSEDGRRIAPAALRNVDPIISVLATHLPHQGAVLEIASGTGQHVAAFAQAFPDLHWMPSDIDAGQRASITAWLRQSGVTNVSEPLDIDVARPWPMDAGRMDVVLVINLFHLVPSALAARFFEEARAAVQARGLVIIYGPFLRGTDYASEGDRSFDASLRARDAEIGYKSVEAVAEMAAKQRLRQVACEEMPANNLMLVFRAG